MAELIKIEGNNLVGLLHGKGGNLTIPKPFERDIFLFDTHVAGTSYIEGIEELEPHLNIEDKLDFFREPDNPHDNYRSLVVLSNPKTILNSKYANSIDTLPGLPYRCLLE